MCHLGRNYTARKQLRTTRLKLEFDVLGAWTLTSDRNAFGFSDDKLHSILADTNAIAALYLFLATQLIGARVIPRCTFTAVINCLPKKPIAKITVVLHPPCVTTALTGEPGGLFLLSQPHRVEPEILKSLGHTLESWTFYVFAFQS